MRSLWIIAIATAAWAADDVKLPASPEDLARGKKLFMGACTYCHGPTGDGGKGADLSRRDLRVAKTDGDLVRIIEVGIPGTEMPGSMHMTARELTQTAAFVRSLSQVQTPPVKGDVPRGQALYARFGCANCHTIQTQGGLMGPDLSIIGSRRNAAHLRESIIAPDASVPNNFLYTEVKPITGRTITGTRLFEDTFTILVRDFNGNNHAIAKDRVKEIVKSPKKSPMPPYREQLSETELDDLVAYLVSLREKL